MEEETPLISNELLNLLICPVTGATLELEENKLANKKLGVSYEIVDGVPFMISENDLGEC